MRSKSSKTLSSWGFSDLLHTISKKLAFEHHVEFSGQKSHAAQFSESLVFVIYVKNLRAIIEKGSKGFDEVLFSLLDLLTLGDEALMM